MPTTPAPAPARDLYEVLYVSCLAPGQPLSVVAGIASAARAANRSMDITGLLVFDGQRFCQHLEGPRTGLLKLIERIRSDERHTEVEVLHHGRITARHYQNFSLAFSTLEDPEALARLHKLDGTAALAAFADVRRAIEL